MKAAVLLARKEARDILREKTIVVALAVQAVVAATSAFLAVGLLGLYDPDSIDAFPAAEVGYTGPGDFAVHLQEAGNLQVHRLPADEALARFSDGRLDMVVSEDIPDPEGTRTISILVPEDEIRTTLLMTQARALLEDYEDALRAARQDRITHDILHVEAPRTEDALSYAFLLTTLLPLLVLTPVFLSGAVAADSLVQEIQQRTLPLLRSTPITTGGILAGKLLTPVVLAPLQVLLWVALLRANDVPIADPLLLAAYSTVLAVLVCGLGMLAAVIVRREGQTQAAYALVALLLAGLSVWMPRDPLNVVALIGSGGLDALAWHSIAWTTVFAAIALLAAVALAGHRMATDRL